MKKLILGSQSDKALYKYAGIVRIRDEKVEDNKVLHTRAMSTKEAANNFRWQIANARNVRYADVFIDVSKITEIDEDVPVSYTPPKPTCDKCGTRLTESGECPICDLGEEDI